MNRIQRWWLGRNLWKSVDRMLAVLDVEWPEEAARLRAQARTDAGLEHRAVFAAYQSWYLTRNRDR